MAYSFNAEEVFKMAVQIEKNGAAFYRKAADLQEDESDRKFLLGLAKMENQHEISFEEMKKDLAKHETAQTVFDPNDELSLYLDAMADAHGGEGDPDVLELITGRESMEEIIKTAIGLEKKSILFYVGLEDLVPVRLGKEKIDKIIREEKKHIAQLIGFLKKIKKVDA